MRILVACGGTGGHFYPGYSAALELRKMGAEVLFLVRRGDPAARVLRQEDLPYAELDLVGLPRTLNPLPQAAFALKLAKALAQARHVLKDWRPDAVLGTGGYISFPPILLARAYSIPALVHESNAHPGLANLVLAKLGAKVAAGLPVTGFPQKASVTLTGTPIRKFFDPMPAMEQARKELGLEEGKSTVLAFGGSQGARGLNAALAEAAKSDSWRGLQLLHITGKKDFEKVRQAYGQIPEHVRLLEYCDRMDLAYAAADLVVCRSGASTVAELLALRKPAALVPFPAAAADHQTANARVLEKAGAALLIPERDGLAAQLAAQIPPLAQDGARLGAMRDAYCAIDIPSPLDSGRFLAQTAFALAKTR